MKNNTPRITVLVPTFNRANFIGECLDSLLAQTLPPSQILVINDGSTDRTAEILESYRGRIECLDTPQLGKAGALNHGLRAATGDYLWIFDDDDVAMADALERLVAPLEADKERDFSFSTFYYTKTDAKSHRIGRPYSQSVIPDLRSRGFLIPLLEENFLGGAALFARRSCYDTLGEFDPALIRSQDYEMAIRFARHCKGVRVEDPPTFHYRQHRGARGSSLDRFAAYFQPEKWRKYDSLFFKNLYESLPLEAYLPPGSPGENRRQALLQRITIMAGKLLINEVLKDLNELSALPASEPFSEQEKLIIGILVATRYRRTWNLLNQPRFPRAVRHLAYSSRTAAMLQKEILKAGMARLRNKPVPLRMLEAGLRSIYLLA